jgi:uncharacterized membrane protein
MISQSRHAANDRTSAAHDYEVNLKSVLEIFAPHEKLDGLREGHGRSWWRCSGSRPGC